MQRFFGSYIKWTYFQLFYQTATITNTFFGIAVKSLKYCYLNSQGRKNL